MIRERLLALNRAFYTDFAMPFAQTRVNPQPGFEHLLDHIPLSCMRVLDVGCGEGRFGRFLIAARPQISYVGVDFSAGLLAEAQRSLPQGVFVQRSIEEGGSLSDLGQFGLVACLAVLQHIPGRTERVRLLREMAARLLPEGRLMLSTWQFMDSERQRRKIVDWKTISVGAHDVEEGDYLLTWRSGGFGLRYVAHIGPQAMASLAGDAGLEVVDSFRSDGKEGDLNLYTVLAPLESDVRSS